MDWQDEGLVIGSRRHGETSAILEVLTAGHGRHSGVVRGGASRRLTPVLQPGARVAVVWSARLEAHLGTFRVEPIATSLAAVLADRAALGCLGSMLALIGAALPERATHPALYARSCELVAALGRDPDWRARYALWELYFLAELGFGLDLRSCAVTGGVDDLVWVSPKSGRAVGRSAGAAWADRLLPLPAFLRGAENSVDAADLASALALTGHFLEGWLGPTLPQGKLPAARARAVTALARH